MSEKPPAGFWRCSQCGALWAFYTTHCPTCEPKGRKK